MLLAIRRTDDAEPQTLFRWLLPASVALHLLAVTVIPNRAGSGTRPALPSIVVMSEPPPEPMKPPDPPAPKPEEPAPAPARAARPVTTTAPTKPEAHAPPPSEAAVDFTGTMFSNDGPGIAIARGPAAPLPVERPVPVASAARPAPAAPPFVAAASLAKPPRAPGLDAELERNYPLDARRSGISGSAVLQVELLPDGRVGKVVRTSESDPGFGSACERTVRSGRWDPPIDREGRAVVTEIKYVCKFEVR